MDIEQQTQTEGEASPKALQGIRVLDLSRVLAGPWASQTLGDLGAQIIKVENPKGGDDTRKWGPPFIQDGPDEGDIFSAYYLSCNRNKSSIAIDMSKPEGADLVRALAKKSDIVIENYKVGGLEKYGLDYQSLNKINPKLIYCSITGFGQTGPYAKRSGYDSLIQAMGGLMSITGPETGEPTKVGVAVIDLFTGLYATTAILAALHYRDQTGEGQYIDCSLLESAVAILANQGMNWLAGHKLAKPMGNAHPTIVPYRPFEVKDGTIIVAVGNDSQFAHFCQILERDDLAQDPRFQQNKDRVVHREILEPQLQQSLMQWQREDILAAMNAANVPGGPINNIAQVFEDEQVQARGMVQELQTENGTTIAQTRFPALLSKTPATIRSLPPALGAQGDALLSDILGLDAEQIAALHAQNIVGKPKQ